ncbi:MAG TPA: hypothetical protein P5026_12785, partial [Kiritimatiellia bacterium]|nr:hypothetical protein [Kiritimatiellia bacterium]
KQKDLDFIAGMVDLKENTDPYFYKNHFLEPVLASGSEQDGYLDYWINYGRVKGWQCVTAKRLTVLPGCSCTIKDNGAYCLIAVQGEGTINGQRLSSPNMIRFHDITDDEFFVVHDAARAGVTYVNASQSEPLEILRYFGPEVNPDAPEIGRHG